MIINCIILYIPLVFAYTNHLFTITSFYQNISESQCDGTPNATLIEHTKKKLKMLKEEGTSQTTNNADFSLKTISVTTTTEKDPMDAFESLIHQTLFGNKKKLHLGVKQEAEVKPTKLSGGNTDNYGQLTVGSVMRAETFQNKRGVHLPMIEYMHRGHCFLKVSPDYMQTAVDAFAILLVGTIDDILRLPSLYVLRSARTIAMMKIEHEKLAVMWLVVKGSREAVEVTFEELEKYRPLFKYLNGREIARLNLTDERIVSFIGTHPDLNRHQVGVVASKYIALNPNWTEARYLNIMNNLLCGVPMNFMRRISENTYLQLSHQLFYHISACDPLQRRFYLGMMTKTQALGKAYSWSAHDVSRLGLLLLEVEGQYLATINPKSMAGISAQVMSQIPARKLTYITDMQIRYLEPKPLNILAKKLNSYNNLRIRNNLQ